MLIPCAEAITAASGTPTAGASGQLVGANTVRNGLSVTVDVAAASPVYLLLGTGTASATNFHFALAAGGNWDGRISGAVWRGAVQFFSVGTPKVGLVEL
jgi:hypothetical protein